MSKILLQVLNKQNDVHSTYYKFLYNDLNKIIDKEDNFGHTRVRFVSRALRNKNDNIFRHVFLEFQRGVPAKRHNTSTSRVYVAEHAPSWATIMEQNSLFDWKDELSIQLPNIPYGFTEIIQHDKDLSPVYLLGIRDCRHHVQDMLHFCYPLTFQDL